MAVYRLEKGELVLLAETLEDMLCPELAAWDDFDDLLRGLGMWLHEEVGDAYRLYRRSGDVHTPEGRLPGVKYMFDVNIDGDNIDYILIGDRLPDYLAVLRLLSPLVEADKDTAIRAKEMVREERQRRGLD